MSNAIFKLGIVGLGNIGFGYDRNSPPSFARTHASAAELHPAVELLWGVDTSVEAREEFQNKYAANSFSRLEDAFSSGAVDIVALAVAVEDRDELWSALLKAKPEVVICEKPLAASAAACAEIADKCSAAGIDLVVNYPRRFISQAARAKHLISSAEIGDLQAGHVWYGKGIANSGSHLVNLLLFLFGSGWGIDQIQLVGPGYGNGDFDAAFRMSRGSSSVTFTPIDVNNFEFAEIDLVFASGRLRFINHAFTLAEQVGLSPAGFDGMVQLADERVSSDVSITDYQLSVMNYVVDSIRKGSGFNQDVEDAISTAHIVEVVLNGSEQK